MKSMGGVPSLTQDMGIDEFYGNHTLAGRRVIRYLAAFLLTGRNGEVAEWSMAHAWKVCRR